MFELLMIVLLIALWPITLAVLVIGTIIILIALAIQFWPVTLIVLFCMYVFGEEKTS